MVCTVYCVQTEQLTVLISSNNSCHTAGANTTLSQQLSWGLSPTKLELISKLWTWSQKTRGACELKTTTVGRGLLELRSRI